ncbi:hypothetical protein OA610_01585 [Prochlorococcus sp. AH-716-F13]|nr:hypothetical protein [Prochlorococcus sp. AH-716-F13]
MAKRLTENQIKEIVKSFEAGKAIDVLFQEFNCTKLTVVRNLKKNLGEFKYKELINKNKSLKGKPISEKDEVKNSLNINIEDKTLKNDFKDLRTPKENINKSDFLPAESFFEIAPLDYEIENSSRKELSSVPISDVDFPKVVYMIVNKKIELEVKLLKDFPEWDFLPSIDLDRKTIEIYFDLNIAKRSCNKDQKVIKVPNTNVFRIVAPILTSRGISRIVSSEKLIAL